MSFVPYYLPTRTVDIPQSEVDSSNNMEITYLGNYYDEYFCTGDPRVAQIPLQTDHCCNTQ